MIEQLDNGLTLLSEHHPNAYSVAYSLQMPLGAGHDPQALFGLCGLTQELLFKGAGDWDAKALATQIDQIGLQESHHSERELITFSGTVLPQHLYAALGLTFTTLNQPHLPETGLDEIRQLALHQLMAMDDAPAQKMFYELGQRFYPPPLSNPAEGTLLTLPAITHEDVQSFWQRFSPNGTILSVAGAFDPTGLLDQVETCFGNWQGPTPASLDLGKQQRKAEHVQKETEQTQIGVAYDSVPFSHPDYLKSRMGVMALSGGMSSRLFVEVRQKRGLAYSVFAAYVTTKHFGGILGYAGTTTERAQETLDVLLAELRRIEQGITPEEFEKAKTRLKTDFIVQGESTRARAEAIAREYFYTGTVRSLDEVMRHIDELTLDEINDYLKTSVPKNFTVLTLGKHTLEVQG